MVPSDTHTNRDRQALEQELARVKRERDDYRKRVDKYRNTIFYQWYCKLNGFYNRCCRRQRHRGDRQRLLLVSHYFLPDHQAGVEVHTLQLAQWLHDHTDFEVAVFTREDGRFLRNITLREERHRGIKVFRLYYNRSLSFTTSYTNPELDDRFHDFLREFQPQLIHFQHLERLSAGFLTVAQELGIPTVLSLHDFWFLCPNVKLLRSDNNHCTGNDGGRDCAACSMALPAGVGIPQSFPDRLKRAALNLCPIPRGLRARLRAAFAATPVPGVVSTAKAQHRFSYLREQLGRADRITAPSRQLIERFRAFGMPTDNMVYLDNGVRLQETGKSASPVLRFGFVGTIAKHKGIDVCIEAFKKVRNPDIMLHIFGPGETTFVAAMQRISQHDPRIRFHGAFDPDESGEVYRQIDMLVVPSTWYENSPLTIHEAQFYRIPVIGSDIGGIAEYVTEGRNGFLFPSGSVDALAELIERIARQPELLLAAADFFPVKSIAANGREFLGIYQSLLP